MEFLQYVSSFLSYPSSFTGYPMSTMEKDSNVVLLTAILSRDRKSQIKRTICFPDVTSLMDAMNTYPSKPQQENLTFASPFEERIDVKHTITSFLQNTVEIEDPMQTLAMLRSHHIVLNEDQNIMLSSIRNSERQEDVLLCFITELLLNAGYEMYCRRQQLSRESFTQFDYGCLVKSGIQWLNSTPISSVFDEDVHYLVEAHRTKSGVLRRHCYMCSPRGSKTHKRTKFICSRCHKPFCLNSTCFELYHQKNGFKYYKDETYRPNWTVCCCYAHPTIPTFCVSPYATVFCAIYFVLRTMEDFDEITYYLRPTRKNNFLLGGLLVFVNVSLLVSGWLQSISAEYANVLLFDGLWCVGYQGHWFQSSQQYIPHVGGYQ